MALGLIGSRKPNHREDDEQMIFAEWVDRFKPKEIRWWHVPNGGRRNPREGARFKRMGVKAGISDNHFLMPDGRLAVIELKIKPNKPTAEQAAFLGDVSTRSNMAACCYSINEALGVLNGWLNSYGLSIKQPNSESTSDERRIDAARRIA